MSVIPINEYARQSQPAFNTANTEQLDSPIMFRAYEVPLEMVGAAANYPVDTHKALVRMYDDKPLCLNVVRSTYKLVQNDELFAKIDQGIASTMDAGDIARARIHDVVAYKGVQCYRQYIFDDVAFRSPDGNKINFQIIALNGFGLGAVKMYAGAIDMFCTNGMILGNYISHYAKHTKGISLTRFKEAVEGSVFAFWQHRELVEKLSTSKIVDDKKVSEWLEHNFGKRTGLKLFRHYLIEKLTRGDSLWALYSTLTFYASHSEGEFAVRNTGNDHEASTMMKRKESVQKLSDDIFQLAA